MRPLEVDRGIDHIVLEEFINNPFWINVFNFLKDSNIKTIADIGASSGISSIYFLDLPEVEKIYCFEPYSESYTMLIQNLSFASDKIVPSNFGIYYGLTKSEVLTSQNQNPLGIFLKNVWSEHPLENCVEESMNGVIFHLGELEEFVPKTPDLIKLDVEGSEWNIIEHSTMLKEARFLIIGFHNHELPYIEEFISKYLPNYLVVYTKGGEAHYDFFLRRVE